MCGRFVTTGTWAEYRKYMNILPAEVDQVNGPQPNYNTAYIHNRMPAILKPNTFGSWMTSETRRADSLEILQQNRGVDLIFRPASKAVGSVKNKDAALVDTFDLSPYSAPTPNLT